MRLAPVPQSAASATYFSAYKLGPWELGRCVAPSYYDNGTPTGRECGDFVRDDGTGYADLDGQPFRAYVCRRCAPRLLRAA
jgi:hypothetical protein